MTAAFYLDGILYAVAIGRKRAVVTCEDEDWDYEHLALADELTVEVDHCRTIEDALTALGVEAYTP